MFAVGITTTYRELNDADVVATTSSTAGAPTRKAANTAGAVDTSVKHSSRVHTAYNTIR